MKRLVVLILLVAVGSLEVVAQEARRDCNGACIALYSPVCGKWGKTLRTFGNSCELGVYNDCHHTNFRILYKGECGKRQDV